VPGFLSTIQADETIKRGRRSAIETKRGQDTDRSVPAQHFPKGIRPPIPLLDAGTIQREGPPHPAALFLFWMPRPLVHQSSLNSAPIAMGTKSAHIGAAAIDHRPVHAAFWCARFGAETCLSVEMLLQ
jgi:hypothetical protein